VAVVARLAFQLLMPLLPYLVVLAFLIALMRWLVRGRNGRW
jgi:hypothetical protein